MYFQKGDCLVNTYELKATLLDKVRELIVDNKYDESIMDVICMFLDVYTSVAQKVEER